jgi:cell wall-associated NlpC family hydrolase
MNLSVYESVPYVDGGRVVSGDPENHKELNGLDCFGLARHALHYAFGGPLLNSFGGIFRADQSGMNDGFNAVVDKRSGSFELCGPQAGALACCFHKSVQGDVFHHIGICIDAANVMHTSAKHGYAVVPVRTFKRLANKVEFYRYVK